MVAQADNYTNVAILGSSSTVKSGLYHQSLPTHDIIPINSDEQKMLDAVIQGHYSKETLPIELLTRFKSMVSRLKDLKCEALILACTELPLLLDDNSFLGVPRIDSNYVLAKQAIDL